MSRRTRGRGHIRESDLLQRRYACMNALIHIGGVSVTKAACRVLGHASEGEVRSTRVQYYQVKRPTQPWQGHFFHWRDWVLSADERTLESCLKRYTQRCGGKRAQAMDMLFQKLRSDPVQAEQNQKYRQGRDCWKTDVCLKDHFIRYAELPPAPPAQAGEQSS